MHRAYTSHGYSAGLSPSRSTALQSSPNREVSIPSYVPSISLTLATLHTKVRTFWAHVSV